MYYSNRKFNNGKPKFAITDTNTYVPVVTFSVQDNEKILQQLKRGFKKQKRNQKKKKRYLNHLPDPSFWGVKRLFVLSFEM